MKHKGSENCLTLYYASRFKYIVGFTSAIFFTIFILYADNAMTYLFCALMLLALIGGLLFAGLFSSKPMMQLDSSGIRDFRLRRKNRVYSWQDVSKISVKNYTKAGYYFVLQFDGSGGTVKVPVGVWAVTGIEIARHIQFQVKKHGLSAEVDFEVLNRTGLDSI